MLLHVLLVLSVQFVDMLYRRARDADDAAPSKDEQHPDDTGDQKETNQHKCDGEVGRGAYSRRIADRHGNEIRRPYPRSNVHAMFNFRVCELRSTRILSVTTVVKNSPVRVPSTCPAGASRPPRTCPSAGVSRA